MIRLLTTAVLLGGCALCQVAPSTPMVARNSSVTPNDVSPGTISSTDQAARQLGDLPPQPKGKTTLLGGRIHVVDHVRDRMVLDVFGGGHAAVLFDERTRVFREGKQESLEELKDGERAYVDTTLDGTAIFARNIRVVSETPTGQGSGQIVDFAAGNGELTLRDRLSPQPVKMRLAPDAVIMRGDKPATRGDLQPGTLVALTFVPNADRQALVRQVSILASPGSMFQFSGRVVHLDLHRGLLVVEDPRDNMTYEVSIDSKGRALTRNVQEGSDVNIEASFDGQRYEARSITINAAPSK